MCTAATFALGEGQNYAKGWVFFANRQWPQVIAEAEAAIADNPNNAEAHAARGFWKSYLGRAEDGFSGLETAFRLSPRDPGVPVWQQLVCVLHNFWRNGTKRSNGARRRARARLTLVHLTAANAGAGHDKEAKEA